MYLTSYNEHRSPFNLKKTYSDASEGFLKEKKEYIHFLSLTYPVGSNFIVKDGKLRKKDDHTQG